MLRSTSNHDGPPPGAAACHIAKLPRELLRKIAFFVAAYPQPKRVGKATGGILRDGNNLATAATLAVFRYQWDALLPSCDLLDHPRVRYYSREPWKRVLRDCINFQATCKAWRACLGGFILQSSWFDLDHGWTHMPFAAAHRHLELRSSAPFHGTHPPISRAAQLLIRTSPLIALSLVDSTVYRLSEIVAALPVNQLEGLALEWSSWMNTRHDVRDSFYVAVADCKRLKRLRANVPCIKTRELVRSLAVLSRLEAVAATGLKTWETIPAPMQMVSVSMRRLEFKDNGKFSISEMLHLAQQCARTLEFLEIAEPLGTRLPATLPLPETSTDYPRLEYLSVTMSDMSPMVVRPAWTQNPNLRDLVERSPRLEHIALLGVPWDDSETGTVGELGRDEQVLDAHLEESEMTEQEGVQERQSTPRGTEGEGDVDTPSGRFLRKMENGIVRRVWLQGRLPRELLVAFGDRYQEWEFGKLELVIYC